MAHAAVYHLPINCSIAQIGDLRRDLQMLLRKRAAVALHGDGVGKIDAVGIQLLFAFVSGLAAAGRQWSWVNPSARLCTAARLLGMSEPLKLS